jgi:hypothetical protein
VTSGWAADAVSAFTTGRISRLGDGNLLLKIVRGGSCPALRAGGALRPPRLYSLASSLACAAATSAPSFCSSWTRFARAKPARWAATWKAATRSSRRGLCRGDLSTELLQLMDSLRASEACQVGGDLEGGHALKPPPECHVRMTTRGLYPHLRNLQIVTPGVAPVTFFFFSWFW